MPDFNPKQADRLYQLLFQGNWPTSVAFIGDGRRLAAGNRDGQLYLWEPPEEPEKPQGDNKDKKDEDPPSVPPARKLDGHTNGVTHLLATPDGATLVSASLDRSVRLWYMNAKPTGEAEVVMDIKNRERNAKRDKTALDAPGVKVAVQSSAHTLEGHRDWVNGLGMSGDGKRLISGDDTGLVIVWDLTSRKQVTQWQSHPGNWVTSASLSPDGKTAFVADYCASRGSFDRPPPQAKLIDAETGKEKLDLMAIQFPNEKRVNSYGYGQKWRKFMGRGFVCSAFSPDGKLLAVGQGGEQGDSGAHLIDTETGKSVRFVSKHKYGVCDVMFSPDGKHVLTSGRDTTIQVSQVADGKQVATIGKSRGGQFKDWLHAMALRHDNRWLAAADIAGYVQVWRMGEAG